MCDSLVKNEKCKVKSRGAGSAYLFFGGRKDIEGRRTGGFFLAEKRFTFAFLSVEEDFGKGRNQIGRKENHSTQNIEDGELAASPSRKKRFTFPFLSIREDFGRGRNRIRRKENYSTQNIADDGLAASSSRKKRFTFPFLSIREDFGRRRNRIGRTMDRIRQCGAYGNAARCIGHRSTLHRPSHGAVFLETD